MDFLSRGLRAVREDELRRGLDWTRRAVMRYQVPTT